MKGSAFRNNNVIFGDYALQVQESGWLTSRQLEATRRTITRYTKRGGKVWIKVFPVMVLLLKSHIGSGKGELE
jgi:large subunit ribosomal protein L16